jgi:hypothetical protein
MAGEESMNPEYFDIEKRIDRLAELYRSNPELFELERKLLIEETIEEFPERYRKRAYGIQFCIDSKLSLAKDPISRMNLMVELFWDQVVNFSHALNDPEDFAERKKKNRRPGQSIPLNPTKH